jgi:hypothetical protein
LPFRCGARPLSHRLRHRHPPTTFFEFTSESLITERIRRGVFERTTSLPLRRHLEGSMDAGPRASMAMSRIFCLEIGHHLNERARIAQVLQMGIIRKNGQHGNPVSTVGDGTD